MKERREKSGRWRAGMAFILSILLLLLTACTPPPRSDQNRQKSSDMTAETESADELSAEVAVEHPTLVEDSHLLDRYPEEEFSAQDDDQDTETISAVPTDTSEDIAEVGDSTEIEESTEGDVNVSNAESLMDGGEASPAASRASEVKEFGIFFPVLEMPPYEVGAKASIVAVGDVLFHSHMIAGGEQEDGTYDYNFMFEYIRDINGQADYALCDMEGTLAGEPYTGYPLFSAPDAVAEAMKNGGFDMVTAMNNHSIDRWAEGVVRTNQVLRDYGLEVIGTRRSEDETTWSVQELNGIKVGFAAWSYETGRQDDQRSLNGITIPEDALPLVNSFTQEEPYFSEDLKRMTDQATAMREAGAEVLIYFLHSGTEYSSEPNDVQRQLAETLATAGVDVIFNCGPHVILPVESVPRPDYQTPILCFYSLGNCVSDQLFDTDNNQGRAEDGVIGMVQFERRFDGSVTLCDAGYYLTYCYKLNDGNGRTKNRPIPVRQALYAPGSFGIEGSEDLFEDSLARSTDMMSNNKVDFEFFSEKVNPSDIHVE